MNDIVLCNQCLSSRSFQTQSGLSVEQLSAQSCINPIIVLAHTPYLLGNNASAESRSILSQMHPGRASRELTNLSLSYGGDTVVALAEIRAKLEKYNLGLMGASTSVYAHRMGGFTGAVKDYQAALMDYRQAVTSNSSLKGAAKQKAYTAFKKMQSKFGNELKTVASRVKARRGMPLTHPDRATNIARSSRNVAKLKVIDQVQAKNLVKFGKHAKFLGNGLAVIDFTSRVGNIHSSYKSGDNWEREMFVESSSFALSASTGIAAVNIGTAALTFFVAATPVGWVGLVIGGAAVAGVAAASSIGMNSLVKGNAGSAYDWLMDKLNSLWN